MRKVAIVMGSKSDLPVAEKAVGVLRDYGVQMEVRVLSAHRCPNEAREFAASAREGGFSVAGGRHFCRRKRLHGLLLLVLRPVMQTATLSASSV